MKEISGYIATAILCVMIALGFAGKLLAEKMVDCADKKKKFWMGFFILAAYMICIFLLFCFLYVSVDTVQTLFIMFTICYLVASISVLLMVLFYYSTQNKRQITELEKLKLKDM